MNTMTKEIKEISEKAIRLMISDLREQNIFSSFDELSSYVKKQFKEQTVIAKTYLKSAMQEN